MEINANEIGNTIKGLSSKAEGAFNWMRSKGDSLLSNQVATYATIAGLGVGSMAAYHYNHPFIGSALGLGMGAVGLQGMARGHFGVTAEGWGTSANTWMGDMWKEGVAAGNRMMDRERANAAKTAQRSEALNRVRKYREATSRAAYRAPRQ